MQQSHLRTALLATTALLVLAAAPAVAFEPVFKPHLDVGRAAGPIDIDGELDDAGWAAAGRAAGFSERYPQIGREPLVETEAWLTYDDDNLYVAFVCRDDPDLVRATMSQRDLYGEDDEVGLLLDTFGDGTWAYQFFANPYGVQKDAMWTSVHGRDTGFDMVWSAAARRGPDGYTVEMAIPISGLRFPDSPVQEWRLDFWRGHPRESERQYSWAAYPENDNCLPCQWGTVAGIEGLHPGRGLEILPSFIGYQVSEIEDPLDADSGLRDDDPKGEPSLGAKFSLSSDITFEATLNPDFSQIESDADQIDVNSTIVQRYPEKRPFFQEGNDLFRTMFNSFYTRMVNAPEIATKGTARWNGTSLGWMMARDEASPYIIPLEERSEPLSLGRSTVNVLRGQHSLGNNSRAGFMVTDRHYDEGGYGTIFSVDGDIRLNTTWSWATQWVHAETREPEGVAVAPGATFAGGKHTVDLDGESYSGPALITELRKRSRRWNMTLDFNQVSPTYRTQTGYDPWNDQRNGFVWNQLNFYPEDGLIERVSPGVFADGRWNYDGRRKWLRANLFTDIFLRRAQTHIGVHYRFGEEVWGDTVFDDTWNAGLNVDVRPSDVIAVSTYANIGEGAALLTLDRGDELDYGLWMQIKPLDRLIIEPQLSAVRSEHHGTGELLFRQTVARARVRYQVNPRLSLRLVVQHNDSRSTVHQNAAPAWYHLAFGRKWEIDPLLTYRLNSFSVFYIGSTHDWRDFNSLDPDASSLYRQTARQYFLKLQYLWQI